MDGRKGGASKLKSKKYGERVNLEATGRDGAPLNPPAVNIYAAYNNDELPQDRLQELRRLVNRAEECPR
jgi:hypothetical protein